MPLCQKCEKVEAAKGSPCLCEDCWLGPARKKIVLALDVPSRKEAQRLACSLAGRVGVLKIGLQLFLAGGEQTVFAAQQSGHEVLLDLKLHDIPNTVARAVESLSRLSVDYLTVHASGGPEMMRAAVEAAGDKTKILAVTLLTSISEDALSSHLRVQLGAGEYVMALASAAHEAGVAGFVCSPREVAVLRDRHPSSLLVVPGVRSAGADVGDQARVGTPAQAVEDGASYIVVGRQIRGAEDPVLAADEISKEILPHIHPF